MTKVGSIRLQTYAAGLHQGSLCNATVANNDPLMEDPSLGRHVWWEYRTGAEALA